MKAFLHHIPLAIILLLVLPMINQAQMIKEVHDNKNDFYLDITSILQYTSNKDYLAKGEALLENFAGSWESSYLSPTTGIKYMRSPMQCFGKVCGPIHTFTTLFPAWYYLLTPGRQMKASSYG